MPTGESYKRFSNLIKKLAKQYNAPVFEPHITLLGDFKQPLDECIKLIQQVVSGQKSFAISMGEIDYEDVFFRTLFVRADKTEPLLNLHNRAKKIFKMGIPPYMPHLSLLYGTFPIKTKKEIIKEIGKHQSIEFEINSVHLIKGGEVEKWQILGEFPLGN